MRCPKCGCEDLAPSFKFCSQCGFLLPDTPIKAKEEDDGGKPDEQQSVTESNLGFKNGENQKEIHSAQTEGVPQYLLANQNAAAGQAQQSTVKDEQQPLTSPIHGAHSQSPSSDHGLCKTKEEAMSCPLEGSSAPNVDTEPNAVDSTSEGSGEVEREPPFVNNELCKGNKASESSTNVSCTSSAVKEEQDPTVGKARDNQDNLPMADQEQKLETDDIGTKEVEGKNVTRVTVTMDHKPSSKELQQKVQGQHNISRSVSIKEESQSAKEDEKETSSLSRSNPVQQEEIPQETISKKADEDAQQPQLHVTFQMLFSLQCFCNYHRHLQILNTWSPWASQVETLAHGLLSRLFLQEWIRLI